MQNHFVLTSSSYVRDINPTKHYIEQSAAFLNISTGKPLEQCIAFVRKTITQGKDIGIRDPKITYLERKENGDREQQTGTLNVYISQAIKNNQIISPPLTIYKNPEDEESLLVSYIEDNVKMRGKAKKEGFAAAVDGNNELAAVKTIEQTGRKLNNNAVSGGHVSPSTILFNPTAHATLTSICRSTSGYGNANNEKFLAGNRHYWSLDIAINNVSLIATQINLEKLSKLIDTHSLVIPTINDLNECILRSTRLYWRDVTAETYLLDFIAKLNGLQRAAVMYIGDIYHLRLLNPFLVSTFINELATKVIGDENSDKEEIFNTVVKAPEDICNLGHQICSEEMQGHGKKHKELKGTKTLVTLAATIVNIQNVLNKYSDIIDTLWVTNVLPASVAYFPNSIRHVAITSDTDSTIFTVQDWVMLECEDFFSDKATRIAATMIFLASQTITHVLAIMSKNLGIVEKRLHQIAMKNEFKFDVFVPTQVAKHYFATITCQEGNVRKEVDTEIKGVHLKSSNAPKRIITTATNLMKDIMETVMKGKKVRILEVLKLVADTERMIIKSILSAELEFFRLGQIKPKEAYTLPERSSPYSTYLFWQEVFATDYGNIAPPPYACMKMSTTLVNMTAMTNWVSSIENKELAKRLSIWIELTKKSMLPTIYLPLEIIQTKGLPKELLPIIDVRRMVFDLCNIFYIVLETLGFYILNEKDTRLVSDEY
jgi:hypothetical protein